MAVIYLPEQMRYIILLFFVSLSACGGGSSTTINPPEPPEETDTAQLFCDPYPDSLTPKFVALHGDTTIPLAVVLVEFNDSTGFAGAFVDDDATWATHIFTQLNDYYADVFERRNIQVQVVPVNESGGDNINDGIIPIRLNMTREAFEEAFEKEDELTIKGMGNMLAPYISASDMASYDKDGNNVISALEMQVLFVIRGYEGAIVSNEPLRSVHGHNFGLLDQTVQIHGKDMLSFSMDGSTNGYTMIGELHAANFILTDQETKEQSVRRHEYMATIGIIAHELGHGVFKLPDLYDTETSNDSGQGIGPFGLMGGGSWGYTIPPNLDQVLDPVTFPALLDTTNLFGGKPVHFSAWSKIQIGEQPYTPTAGVQTSYTLHPAAQPTASATATKDIVKLATQRNNEYFLVEYRNFADYDEGLYALLDDTSLTVPASSSPGGVLIWHIDDNRVCLFNRDNAYQAHKRVDVEEANGSNGLDNNTTNGMLSHLYTTNSSFHNDSLPDSRTYSGQNSSVAVTVTNMATAPYTATINVYTGH